MSTDTRSAAWEAVHDPATAASELAAIAAAHPEFAAAIAQHPHAYPELVAWARSVAGGPAAPGEPAAVADPAVTEAHVTPAVPAVAASHAYAAHTPQPAPTRPTRLSGILWTVAFAGFVGIPVIAQLVASVLWLTTRAVGGDLIQEFWGFGEITSPASIALILLHAAAGVATVVSSTSPARRFTGLGLVVVAALLLVFSPLIGLQSWWPLWWVLWSPLEVVLPLVWAALLFTAWALTRPIRGAGWAALPVVAVLPFLLVAFAWQPVLELSWSWGGDASEFLYLALLVFSTVVIPAGGIFLALRLSAMSGRRPARATRPDQGLAPVAGTSRTNPMAILSLVCAFLISVLAVVFGHLALSQIRRTGEEGRGLAIAGLVLGYVGLGVGLIVLIVYGVAFGALLSSYS